MRVVNDYPPMFDEIDACFKVRGKPVIYAWGDIVYNPLNVTIIPALHAHEGVHGHRQGKDIEGWWRRYIDDIAFRREEEAFAHVAEYMARLDGARNRNERRGSLKITAKRLSSPLYGQMFTRAEATRFLRATT